MPLKDFTGKCILQMQYSFTIYYLLLIINSVCNHICLLLVDINTELDIILHHEQLPMILAQSMELFSKEGDLTVLDPEQLIWLYISTNNTNSNEFDFKKALDLLKYIPGVSLVED